MKGTLTILHVDSSTSVAELDRKPTLEELQSCVGGYVEVVPMFETYNGEPCVVFCNEEGKLDRLPLNKRATVCWGIASTLDSDSLVDDVLVGPVVICQGDAEFMESL